MAALCAGCALPPAERIEPIAAPKIGALESAYDRQSWRWVRNPDGRALLTHATLRDCFVDPQPPGDAYDAGFRLEREERRIGGADYGVLNVFDRRDFWEAVYTRAGEPAPLLAVYARGRCQREAERILEAYERGRSKP